MRCIEGGFVSEDGLKLFSRTWLPSGPAKGALCLVHGLGEHCGRYNALAEHFTGLCYIFASFDLRGHGRSQGKRGHAPSYESLMKDIDLFLELTRKDYPDIPAILYGHSMGGNLVLNHVLRKTPVKVKAAIATSPWLRLSYAPGKPDLLLARLMDRIYPAFTKRTGLKSSDLSSDGAVGRQYDQDPLVHSLISVRMFRSLEEAGAWAVENAGLLTVPLLLMHGGDDRITSCAASSEFAGRAGSGCELKVWEGQRHELHNDTGRDKAIGYISSWLDRVASEM